MQAGSNAAERYARVDGLGAHPVALGKPNPWGFRMPGNALEWVHDWYTGYYRHPNETDPEGPTKHIGVQWERVLRGSDRPWSNPMSRSSSDPSRARSAVGLRPVRSSL